MTPAEIDALIFRVIEADNLDEVAKDVVDALAALARERDAAHDLVRCFMGDFDVLDLSDEAYDSIEKRAQQLWDVVKERDALARENGNLNDDLYTARDQRDTMTERAESLARDVEALRAVAERALNQSARVHPDFADQIRAALAAKEKG